MNGAPPDQGIIADWFCSKPESYFSSIEDQAFERFYGFAGIPLKEHIDESSGPVSGLAI
jgi:hypothetical protein